MKRVKKAKEKMENVCYTLFVFGLFFSLTDIMTTVCVLNLGASELNPIMAYLFDVLGIALASLLNIAISVLCLLLLLIGTVRLITEHGYRKLGYWYFLPLSLFVVTRAVSSVNNIFQLAFN